MLLLLALVAGAMLPVQAALNARLGRELGNPAIAALASFVVGGAALLLYLLAARAAFPHAHAYARVPPHLWLGGILGALYVAMSIVITPRIGVAAMIGLAISGQIAMSVVLDHFGLLNLPHHPVSVGRIVGVCLLAAGVVLVKRF